jgi:hypothetical protein
MLITQTRAKSLLGMALLATTVTLGCQVSAKAQEEDNEIFQLLVQTAEIMNEGLPMMIDQDVQWDSSFAGPGNKLTYNYTLVNYLAAEIDSTLFVQNIRQPLINSICTDPETQFFPDNGVLLNFNYYDNVHNLIANVEVLPTDCNYIITSSR